MELHVMGAGFLHLLKYLLSLADNWAGNRDKTMRCLGLSVLGTDKRFTVPEGSDRNQEGQLRFPWMVRARDSAREGGHLDSITPRQGVGQDTHPGSSREEGGREGGRKNRG